jgi:hypothetical protein
MFPAINHFKDPGFYLISKVPLHIHQQSHTMVDTCTSVCLHIMTGKMQFTTSKHVNFVLNPCNSVSTYQ